MTLGVMFILLAQLGPELTLEGCAEGWVDARQVQAQLRLGAAVPGGKVTVQCLAGGAVRLTHEGASREVTLTGTSAAQRERTLALLIASWLERADAGVSPPPVEERRPRPKSPTVPLSPMSEAGPAERWTSAAEAERKMRIGEATQEAGERASEADPPLVETEPEVPDAGPPVIDSPPLAPTPSPPPQEETLVPIELSLVPGVGLNRLFPPLTRNLFAFGLLGVSSNRVDGLSLGPVTLIDAQLRGVQLGLVSISGDVTGFQFGGAFTMSRADLRGVQLGLINRTPQKVLGLQAGALNIAGPLWGTQLGAISTADDVHGLQLGLLFASSAKNVVGVQAGTGLSLTRGSVRGVQLGVLNVAGDVTGAQLGVINVADDLTGFQFGLVNLARSVTGTQIGLVNFSRDNPAPLGAVNVTEDAPIRVALSLGDTHLINLALKSGGRRLYGLLSLGWVPRATARAGGGLGLRLGALKGTGWFAQVEFSAHAVIDLDAPERGLVASLSLGFNLGYRVAPRLGLFIGPQLSLLLGSPAFPGQRVSLFALPLNDAGMALAPGGQLGLEF